MPTGAMRTIREHSRTCLAATSALAAALSLCAFAGAAAAATAPAAITGPVTATASTSATLTGNVNPNGDATSWHFDYGKTASYGTSTQSMSAGSGTVTTGVSVNVTGLSPGTTYHYRLVASNGGGTTNGADGIFNTSTAAAPTVTTSAATGVTSSSATLNGSFNPNGQPTTYYFEYGTSTSYGTKTGVQNGGSDTNTVTVSATIAGLQSGKTYHFRLVASSDSGTTQGSDMTFTPSTGPSVTTKAATSVTSSGAKLNGSVNPNGQATSYYFEYGTTTSYGSKTAAASAGAGTGTVSVSATISGLGPGVYHFRLVASSSAGTSSGSDLTFGSAGPPVVQTGSAQGASTNGVTLTGAVNPQGASTSWYFQYGPTASYGSTTPSKSAGSSTSATGVSAAITNLKAGTTYHYRLVGKSSAGTTYGSDVTFSTAAAVTIATSTVELVAGHFATLSGAVSSRQSGVTVTVLAQQFGSSSFRTVGTSLTGAGGSWTFQAKPMIQTAYAASTSDGTSSSTTIGVRPAVSLRVITRQRFTTRVVAGSSFAGKIVQLQRLLPGNRWQTVAKARLNSKSSAIFAASTLPKGASSVRIAMSINQAGPGYLGAFSRTISYRRA
jgi:phosphodiesterase/alkaline phosphatase D-like protein